MTAAPAVGQMSSWDANGGYLELTTTNFDELLCLFPAWQGKFEQISAGSFEGKIRVARSRQARVFRAEVNQRVLTRGMSQAGWVDIGPVFAGNADTCWHRQTRMPGDLIVRGEQGDIENLTGRQADILIFSVPVDRFIAALQVVPGAGERPEQGWQAYRPEATRTETFRRSVLRLLQPPSPHAGFLGFAERHAQEQECLVLALLALTARNHPRKERQPRRRSLVQKAEEILRAHLRTPLGLVDLCSQVHVSARTLQYAFVEQYGVGPIEFLRTLRLNAVRSDLCRAQSAGQPVREVASRWGYRHLGNFAADYQRHFGELPSQTRRREVQALRSPGIQGSERVSVQANSGSGG